MFQSVSTFFSLYLSRDGLRRTLHSCYDDPALTAELAELESHGNVVILSRENLEEMIAPISVITLCSSTISVNRFASFQAALIYQRAQMDHNIFVCDPFCTQCLVAGTLERIAHVWELVFGLSNVSSYFIFDFPAIKSRPPTSEAPDQPLLSLLSLLYREVYFKRPKHTASQTRLCFGVAASNIADWHLPPARCPVVGLN